MHLMITYPAWSEGHVVCDRGSRPSRIRNHEDMHLLPVPNCDRVTTKRERERQKKCTHFFKFLFRAIRLKHFLYSVGEIFFSFFCPFPRFFSLSFSHPREFARPLSLPVLFNPE